MAAAPQTPFSPRALSSPPEPSPAADNPIARAHRTPFFRALRACRAFAFSSRPDGARDRRWSSKEQRQNRAGTRSRTGSGIDREQAMNKALNRDGTSHEQGSSRPEEPPPGSPLMKIEEISGQTLRSPAGGPSTPRGSAATDGPPAPADETGLADVAVLRRLSKPGTHRTWVMAHHSWCEGTGAERRRGRLGRDSGQRRPGTHEVGGGPGSGRHPGSRLPDYFYSPLQRGSYV
jgi:hypothetical protein